MIIRRPSIHRIKVGNNVFKTTFVSEKSPHRVDNPSDFYSSRKIFNSSYTTFGNFFSTSRNSSIAKKNRITFAQDIISLPQNDFSEKAFQFIKQISNSKIELKPEQADKFLQSYRDIFKALDNFANWTKSDFFMVPLKGGGVITDLYNNIPEEKVIKVDCKRVPLFKTEGDYGFGMHFPHQNSLLSLKEADEFLNQFEGKNVTMLELCVASGITTIGFLLDLHHRGIKPSKITILSTAMAQQGYEISKNFAKTIGLNINYITGKLIFDLKDHFKYQYDPLVYEDGSLVVKSPYDAFQMLYNADNL